MFGKKEKQQQEQGPKKEGKYKMEPYEIHVMPPKFHKYLSVKKGGFGKFVIILVIIFFVIIIAVGVTFYFLSSARQQQPSQPQIPEEQTPSVDETDTDQPETNDNQPETNANQPETNDNQPETNANQPETNENQPETNENMNLNVPQPEPAVTLSSSQDSDNDKLTDIEEDLYNTEKRMPDTDEDSYLDGQEIISGYNPKAAGGSLLATSGLVNSYKNPIFNYEILHPAGWLARPSDQSLRNVIFLSATGEFIEVTVEDNPEKEPLVTWFTSQSPLTDIKLLDKKTTTKGYDVLISTDKLTYYVSDKNNPEKVYVINYNIGNKVKLNFFTTFEMMLNSFQLSQLGGI